MEVKNTKLVEKIFELETKLFPCLLTWSLKGVKIDVEKKLKALGKTFRKKRKR